MDKITPVVNGKKYDMAAGFFYKRYRKGTKWGLLRMTILSKDPFYQRLRNSLHNFSTHLLTVEGAFRLVS